MLTQKPLLVWNQCIVGQFMMSKFSPVQPFLKVVWTIQLRRHRHLGPISCPWSKVWNYWQRRQQIFPNHPAKKYNTYLWIYLYGKLTTLLVPDRRTIVQSLDVALWKETILVSPISSTENIVLLLLPCVKYYLWHLHRNPFHQVLVVKVLEVQWLQ